MAKKVQIYTTDTCHFCHLAKEFFKANNVDYEEINVTRDVAKQQEMINKSGQMGVPIIDVGGEIVIGFNERKLRELLEITG